MRQIVAFPPIAQVCHQIRNEVLPLVSRVPIVYEDSMDGSSATCLVNWIRGIHPRRRRSALQQLIVESWDPFSGEHYFNGHLGRSGCKLVQISEEERPSEGGRVQSWKIFRLEVVDEEKLASM